MSFFNQFKFQTPENVELEFTLAGIGNRTYALLIDYTVLVICQIIYLFLFIFLSAAIADLINKFGIKANVEIWIAAITGLIFFFIYVGYFIIFETLWRGQTPGKRYVKIRVIRDDGRPVRLQQATLRSLLRPIDDILCLGIFFIILGKREKRIGDWVAGTIVIQEEQPVSVANFTLSQAAEKLALHLETEATISHLLPEDFAVIREYLRRRDEMLPQAKTELSLKLAHQIKDIILLETVPAEVTPTLFLEAVYIAYQRQSSEY